MNLSQSLTGQNDPGRFIGLSPERVGGQVGTIGLDQQPVERHAGRRGSAVSRAPYW